MASKRQINGKDVLNDLRSGMSAWELQVRYKLSGKSLQAILKKLVERNAISHSELYELSSFYTI
jgi:Mor family transcriptional regulator